MNSTGDKFRFRLEKRPTIFANKTLYNLHLIVLYVGSTPRQSQVQTYKYHNDIINQRRKQKAEGRFLAGQKGRLLAMTG